MSNLESFYRVAQVLKEQNFFESQEPIDVVNSFKRFYVSRLYYAIFHGAKSVVTLISEDLPEDDKFKEKKKEVHGQVKGFFSFLVENYPNVQDRYRFKKLTGNISRLHKFRKICDYTDGNIEDLDTIVEDAEILAQDSYKRINSILEWLEKR